MSISIASIQDRLRNVAKSTGKDFQLILTRYFQERLLFRLSQTTHRDNFCLKGGALLYALERETSRPTLDIDLLSLKIRMDKQRFDGIFREICSFLHPEDGVQFDYEKITVAEIMEQRRYAGLEIKVPVSLGTMRQMMKIDIGFGDVVTPQPDFMTYPTLLDMNAPEIKAYSRETVIAEKFEAMIDLSESNSRMKDFYDVHQLLSQKQFDPETLQRAISQTFKNRGTIVRLKHPIFEALFADDPTRNKLWEGFLHRSKLGNSVAFSEVMQCIREHLKSVYENLS
jgi:predicted nucleotidyltransferase component of viral defense system